MCGILGFINFKNEINKKKFAIALNTLNERGPDSTNFYFSKMCALGHKRLSIIDLSKNASQPMSDKSGRYTIVYNGEIYNFIQLKKELYNFNQHWKTNSDTEVVLYSYLKWGSECLKKFEGMFSFAIWDNKNNSIFAARDRMGVKPFYYSYENSKFTFSSRPQSILFLNDKISKNYNEDAINIYLSAGYIPAPYSIYSTINQLQAGHYIKWSQNNLKIVNWWNQKNYSFNKSSKIKSTNCYLEELENLLFESVKKRLISDVPIGVFLSGGIDSSLIAAFVKNIKGEGVKSFSIGFNDVQYDESIYSSKVAKYLGIKNESKILNANDLLNLMPTFEKNFDEPFSDSACFPTMALSRLAKNSVKVVLSGDGGDELFGGYDYYKIIRKVNFIMKLPKNIRHLMGNLLQILPSHKLKLLGHSINKKNVVESYGFIRSVSKDFYNLLLQSNSSDNLFYKMFYKSYLQMPNDLTVEEYASRLDLKHTLGDGYLQKLDLSSMAFSLEAREPFLDSKIIEFSLKLPWNKKVSNGVTKFLLKKLCYKYLPHEIVTRKKKGFEVPVGHWIKGPLKEWALERIEENSLYHELPFNKNDVKFLFKLHQTSKRNVTPFLWNILILLNFVSLKKV